MKNLNVKSLIEQYNNGTLSDEERAVLESWYINEIKSNKDYQGLEDNLIKIDQSLLHIFSKSVKKRINLWPKIAVAASIIMVLGLGLYLFTWKSRNKAELVILKNNDIAPAGLKAYLTLGNGKRIALTGASNGVVATQNDVQITKTADGQLVYNILESNSSATSLQNMIETPNAGRYEIILPDGTHVWMNAASTLKYPTSFSSLKERKVELVGEAYFEVAKDKRHPFIVKTLSQEVKVLGTHFNINSYQDEPAIKTTLLEGSVKITLLNGKSSKMLLPGQRAEQNGNEIEVNDADLDQAISWKNGDFMFTGEDLGTVMREIARWYNVEIEFKGTVNSPGVVSTISRTKKLSQVLKALQINQGFRFKIEGRRIIVMS